MSAWAITGTVIFTPWAVLMWMGLFSGKTLEGDALAVAFLWCVGLTALAILSIACLFGAHL